MSKEKVHRQIINKLNTHSVALAEALVKRGVFVQGTDENSYEIPKATSYDVLKNSLSATPDMQDFFEFRNVVSAVFYELYPDQVNEKSLKQKIIHLEEDKLLQFPIRQGDKNHVLQMLDNLDDLINDPLLQQDLLANKINIVSLSNQLLENFGKRIVTLSFKDQSQNQAALVGQSADLYLNLELYYYSPIIIEFKIRKKDPLPDEKMLLQSLDYLNNSIASTGGHPYLFLIVFTNISPSDFNRMQLRYQKIIQSIKELRSYNDQIKFVPISISSLSALREAFTAFQHQHGRYYFNHTFIGSLKSTNSHETLETFYKEIFEVKQIKIEIELKPVETTSWRLGLEFSKTRKFEKQSDSIERKETASVYITTGEFRTTHPNGMISDNYLSLHEVGLNVINDQYFKHSTYRKEPTKVTIEFNREMNSVKFSVEMKNNSIGYKTYDLSEYKYFRIFASSSNSFTINSRITVDKRGSV